MDKFSDMFDNACQMDEGSSEEMEELDEAETLYKNSGLWSGLLFVLGLVFNLFWGFTWF